ncbi:MAG TPA: 16S rRNA (cytidine(1402)-2'-O)-methyltransferase [Rhizomicrobium sp.]|nr:16S rRNA (cytidine(1402)-2'-O)-methyltransferase [Rhizomicrobium sp.]
MVQKNASRSASSSQAGSSQAGPSPGSDPKAPAPGGKSPASLVPGLYICATPIGNARDITLRALDALGACDAILAEDTRQTSKLLSIHGISKPLVTYNDYNAAGVRPKLLQRLHSGARLVLVSDAGTPLVSDPGYKLVRSVIEEGLPVFALPGASAALTALTLGGLPTDRFFFAGFLPSRGGERRSAIQKVKAVDATLIFFESAQRLGESLASMAEILGAREAVVARELTKLHEELRRGTLASLAAHYAKADAPKGEITLLVGPPQDAEPDYARADKLLDSALAFMPVRAAADLVAEALDLPRRALYERALTRKGVKHEPGA